MKTSLKITVRVVVLAFAGCAQVPIGEVPQSDLEACNRVSEGYSGVQRLGERAAVGGVKGVALGAAIKTLVLTIPKIGVATFSIGSLILPMAAFGVADGLFEIADRKSQIVRDCLRDRGIKVY